MTRPRLPFAPLALLALACMAPVAAQVPDGHFVTSHGRFASAPGLGGLWLHHPRRPGQSVPVTGLPNALTGAGASGQAGANCVVRLSDGRLLVGTMSAAPGSVELHVVALAGNAYDHTRSASMTIGTAGGVFNLGMLSEIQIVSPTQVLVCIDGIASPPALAGQVLAIVDWAAASVTPIPVLGLPPGGLVQAAATDGVVWAYVALTFPNSTTTLFAVPYPGGGLAIPLATLAGLVSAIDIDAAGMLLVAIGTAASGDLAVLTPAGTVLRRTRITSALLNGFAPETVTGGFAFVDGSALSASVSWGDGNGLATLLAGPPAGGWGIPTGVDVAPDPVAYDAPSGGGPLWRLAPNPGGLPLAGNGAFHVAVDPPLAGAWLLGCAPAQVRNVIGLGIDLLVSPQGAINGTMSAGTIALPIPASFPRGLTVYVQTFHLASPLAASPGLRITTL